MPLKKVTSTIKEGSIGQYFQYGTPVPIGKVLEYHAAGTGVLYCKVLEYHAEGTGVLYCKVLEYHAEGTGVLYCKVLEYHAEGTGVLWLLVLEFYLEETGNTCGRIYFMNWCFFEKNGSYLFQLLITEETVCDCLLSGDPGKIYEGLMKENETSMKDT